MHRKDGHSCVHNLKQSSQIKAKVCQAKLLTNKSVHELNYNCNLSIWWKKTITEFFQYAFDKASGKDSWFLSEALVKSWLSKVTDIFHLFHFPKFCVPEEVWYLNLVDNCPHWPWKTHFLACKKTTAGTLVNTLKSEFQTGVPIWINPTKYNVIFFFPGLTFFECIPIPALQILSLS